MNKTIGQRKLENERKELGEEIRIPTFYKETIIKEVSEGMKDIPKGSPTHRAHDEAVAVLQKNRQDLAKINNFKEAVRVDPTRTKSAALVDVFEFGQTAKKRIMDRTIEAEDKLNEYRRNIETSINQKIEETAEKSRQGDRIQQYLLNLPDKADRMSFLRKARKDNDLETLSVILTGRPYLSGLSDADIKQLKKSVIQSCFPDEHRSITHIETLTDNLVNGYSATEKNLEALDTQEVHDAIELRKRAKEAQKFDD